MSLVDDYQAALETTAVFRLPNRALVEFTGEDRARFLHNFCTNDIKALGVDSGCEAIFTNIKARAMGHGFVFAGESSHWLETGTAGLDELLQHLDKYLITDDVEINRRDDLQQVLVTGPAALERVATACSLAGSLDPFSQVRVEQLWLRRSDPFGQPGITIAGPEAELDAFIGVLCPAGRPVADADAFEPVRLQAGFPNYGLDFSEDHLAPEVGRIEQAISYRKGCYLGQEPIARIDALGHVNKSLCSIEIAGSAVPAKEAKLTNADGTEVGSITSAAMDPTGDRCFALAWLKFEQAKSGTELKFGDRVAVVR